ncbi:ATP-grasp domain-containing protein [Thiorhodovibrio frisius]|nr:ATP-grasp domain-containing protein [Thiorhodovibrio frisius]
MHAMRRIWFNRTFSSVRALFELIRQGDTASAYRLFCTHPHPSFPGFDLADEWALEPADLSDEDYLEYCLGVCREQRVDAFWPGKAAELIARHQARFAALGVPVLAVADADTLALLRDKARFYDRAQAFSVPPPAHRCLTVATEFEPAYAALRTLHSRLCVKPAEGVNGIGFRVIDEQRSGLELWLQGALHTMDLPSLRQLLQAAESFPPLLLMEYLDGPEYSVDAIGDGRKLVALVQREKAPTGAYGQRIVALPAIEQAVSEMTAALGLRGLFNVQFREGESGLRLLEINPRFAGGIGYTGLTGVNLPYVALHGLLQGFPTGELPAVAIGMRILEVSQVRRVEVPAITNKVGSSERSERRAEPFVTADLMDSFSSVARTISARLPEGIVKEAP